MAKIHSLKKIRDREIWIRRLSWRYQNTRPYRKNKESPSLYKKCMIYGFIPFMRLIDWLIDWLIIKLYINSSLTNRHMHYYSGSSLPLHAAQICQSVCLSVCLSVLCCVRPACNWTANCDELPAFQSSSSTSQWVVRSFCANPPPAISEGRWVGGCTQTASPAYVVIFDFDIFRTQSKVTSTLRASAMI